MLGVWIGKCTLFLLRLAGRNATSLPGKVALAISPRLLQKLGGQLTRCMVVTGTNGKTTTARLLSAALAEEGPVIHNEEGANLPQGLLSALLRHTSWSGKLLKKTALFEIDEATLPLVSEHLPIKLIAITNVFRDQLDRYGELDTTVQKLLEGMRNTDALAVLNADDPLARHIGLQYGKKVVWYGLSKRHMQEQVRDQMRDGAFCVACGSELQYDGFFYGQLGVYRCPSCDFVRPVPDFKGSYDLTGAHAPALTVQQGELPSMSFELPVRGIFNMYNALCAVAAARACGLPSDAIQAGLLRYQSPLGRMQTFSTSPPSVLNLIKNPTGCDSVIQAILSEPGEKVVCIAINDQAADGKDVSWLWDADFEWLCENPSISEFVTAGFRAEDMALRLKYAGAPTSGIHVNVELEYALDHALALAHKRAATLYLLVTYTALYPMAHLLQRRVPDNESTVSHRASVS